MLGWSPRARATPWAAPAVEPDLRALEHEQDWSDLVAALRLVMAGERGDTLVAGLDPLDTAIVRRALEALSGTVALDVSFDDVLARASTSGALSTDMNRWEPIIAGVVAAAQGDARAAPALEPQLRALEDRQEWADLVTVLRRVMAGERGDGLLASLDPVDTAIVRRALEALSGTVTLEVSFDDVWARASTSGALSTDMNRWEPIIAGVVAAAQGDARAALAVESDLRLEDHKDWADLVAVLRRIMAGERGDGLLAGLDLVDTAEPPRVR